MLHPRVPNASRVPALTSIWRSTTTPCTPRQRASRVRRAPHLRRSAPDPAHRPAPHPAPPPPPRGGAARAPRAFFVRAAPRRAPPPPPQLAPSSTTTKRRRPYHLANKTK